MPTGYTYGIHDGSVTTLREFALRAARGMGALLPLREAPPDAPIPRCFEARYEALRRRARPGPGPVR